MLSTNFLNGTIPTQLGKLTLLEIMDLSKNRLKGSIPSQLGELEYLTRLNLDHNDLSNVKIPETLVPRIPYPLIEFTADAAPESIAESWLRSPEGTIPKELGSLISMTKLRISGANINGTIP